MLITEADSATTSTLQTRVNMTSGQSSRGKAAANLFPGAIAA
jgi:hypothetical protein